MKTVLLHINPDDSQTTRLNAAVALARAFYGDVKCVQATPVSAFALYADPYNAAFDLSALYQAVREAEEAERQRIEARLTLEGIAWEWRHVEAPAAAALVEAAKLADIVVLSRPDPGEAGLPGPLPIAAEVAVDTRIAVLAVPVIDETFDCSGSALVAWNGSHEAAQALRLALPLLHHAPDVQLVTISEAPVETDAEQAIAYLARHGVSAKARERSAGKGSVAEALIESAAEMDAAYVVMGAYGHSRVRETILGGVTRDLLHTSPLPLLMAH